MSGIFPITILTGLDIPANPTNIAQDLLDFTGNGAVQGSRYINPTTKDFVLDANGKYKGMNATDQSVWLALSTSFNSSSVPGLGNNINRTTVPVITPMLNNQMTSLITQCLSSLIANGFIRLGPISVSQTSTNEVLITFTYFNVSLGQTQPLSFTFNGGNVRIVG